MQKNQEISHENTDFQFPFKNQQGWQQSPGVEGQLLTSDRAGSIVHTLHHFLLSPWQVKWRWVAPIMYCGTHALLSLGLACLASHVTCPMLTVTVICKSDAWVWSKPLYDHPLWCSSWVLDPWEFLQTTPQAFRKCRGTRDQIANICWIIEKARECQKYIYFCFIDYAKAFDCVNHNKKPWKILRDGNTRPPYLPPEKPVCRSRSNS